MIGNVGETTCEMLVTGRIVDKGGGSRRVYGISETGLVSSISSVGRTPPSAPNPLVRLSEAIKTEADGTAPPSLRLLFRQLPLQMLQVGDRFLNLLPLLVDDCPAFA
jgi:hypothetical protein